MLIFSQVVLSLQLPFAVVPLLLFKTRKKYMGQMQARVSNWTSRYTRPSLRFGTSAIAVAERLLDAGHVKWGTDVSPSELGGLAGLLVARQRRAHFFNRQRKYMSKMTMKDLAKAMGKIDFTMLTSRTEGGQLATRPMSNNGEVEYDGDSYYFSWDSARTVSDIARAPQVALSFQGSAGLLGKPPLFVAVEGTAEIIRDKSEFAAHWSADLERWFSEGIDTAGMVMIHVHADRIHYWDGADEGEVSP